VPYPVDYGGVIDLYWKIRSLHQAGIKIHLHCFEYGRGKQDELKSYCEEVNYYKRNEGHKGFSTSIPYIVASRSSAALSENLLKDDYPVLLEGIHCTFPLYDDKLKNRKIAIRLHNVEYEYYYQLYKHETSLFKKAYYFNESRLLKCYEKDIANKASIFAVSLKDVDTYKKKFAARDISYLPVFIPFQDVQSLEGMGTYCLYHGNLSIAENEKAVIWLLEKVFNKLKIPFVVAGKNPSSRLHRLVESHCQTCLVANPGEEEMKDLISKAQINIIPSFNETGVKLKLLNALYNGRHCVVNDASVSQTGLETTCHIGTSPESFKEIILQLYRHVFSEEEIRLRKKILLNIFDNQENGKRLINNIWEGEPLS
jgi:glycosyltransferase involved in cell wall biosynthesis